MRIHRTIKQIIFLALVVLVIIAAAIAFLWKSAEPDTIQREIVKSLLQLGVVVVLGSAISAVIKAIDQDRIKAQEAAALRTDYLRRVGSAYRSAKAVRRNLRAAGLTRRYGPPPDFVGKKHLGRFQKEMRRLNEAQLGLEALKIEASSLPEYHRSSEIASSIEKMEKYLRGILREYERYEPHLVEGTNVPFSEFPRLDEFTESARAKGKPEDYQLKRDFALSYDLVVALISKDLRIDSA
jgi:hypothetical protein